jgi:hypothetical protein
VTMTTRSDVEIYYDPCDFEIDNNPYLLTS